MKNQEARNIESLFILLLLPFNLPIQLINRFLFHIFKDGIKSYKFFDSIIIFDNEENFINILPTSCKEQELINKYIIDTQNIDLEKTDIFFKLNYGNEERNK